MQQKVADSNLVFPIRGKAGSEERGIGDLGVQVQQRTLVQHHGGARGRDHLVWTWCGSQILGYVVRYGVECLDLEWRGVAWRGVEWRGMAENVNVNIERPHPVNPIPCAHLGERCKIVAYIHVHLHSIDGKGAQWRWELIREVSEGLQVQKALRLVSHGGYAAGEGLLHLNGVGEDIIDRSP